MTSLMVPTRERELAAVPEQNTYFVEERLFEMITGLHDLKWDVTRGAEPFQLIPVMNHIRSQFDTLYGQLVEAAKR